MEYANKNNIILKLNEINKDENFPLLVAIHDNDIEIVKLLMAYFNENNTLL